MNKDIVSLFLGEALTIGAIGATLGLGVGIGVGYVLTATMAPGQASGVAPVYFVNELASVWGLSVCLSAAAGLYPALKAAKLTPMVALRRE